MLLMELPYESELKDRIQELWDRLKTGDFQGSFAQHAQELLETTAQQLPVAQKHDLTQIEQLIAQQQTKTQESRDILRHTLSLYQDVITKLTQQQTNTLITPEDYAAQVAKVIKEYEGWAGKSDTPASDNRDAQRLIDNVATYKEQYEQQQKMIEAQRLQNATQLRTCLNEYVDLITATHDYLIIKQQSARENYTKQSSQEISLAEKARLYTHTVKTVVSLRQACVQDITPAKLFLQTLQSQHPGFITSAQTKELETVLVLAPQIIEQQTLAKERLHAHFTQAFTDYQQTSNVHNLNKLRALQKLLTQKYQEVISLAGEYQELEHNITTSGEKLAFTDTLKSIPHRPQLPFDATKEL